MHLILFILGFFLATVVPLYHIRKVFHKDEKQFLNMLKKEQKRAYYIALVGTLLLSYILTFSLVTLMMNGIYMIIGNPKEALLSIAIMIIPFLIIATIGVVTFYVPFKHTVPEAYVYNHQLANLILIIMGVVSFFIVAALGYFLFLGVEQLIGSSEETGGFVQMLESGGFHPMKLLFYSLFLPTTLVFLGGILGLMTRRRRGYR